MNNSILLFGDTSTWNLPDFDTSKIDSHIRTRIQEAEHVVYNLEGPIAFEKIPPFRYREDWFGDFCLQKIAQITKKYQPLATALPNILPLFDLGNGATVMLANNHTKDAGKANLFQTVETLEQSGHTVIGYGKNRRIQVTESSLTKNITLLSYNFVGSFKYGLPFYLFDTTAQSYGASHTSFSQIKSQIKSLQNTGQKVILSLHIGRQSKPIEEQDIPFDTLKDLGADIIVLHHPHYYLKSEYEEENIFILGDFIFYDPNLPIDRPSAYLEIEVQDDELIPKLHTYTVSDYYPYL